MPPHSVQPGSPPDPTIDTPLFRSPWYSPYAAGRITCGTDIYAKITPGQPPQFYLLHWSEQKPDAYAPVSEECTLQLLRGLVLMPYTARGIHSVNIRNCLPEFFLGNWHSCDAGYALNNGPYRK
ncbi:hypothetical protein [Methanoregula sp.]|uniref:hypothetical protein n=1 Tax=Methanoregula sp. TaxID=2052170 RepID=UPI002620CFD2|nr:hypothetical protein [Methanoregula sp.]